MSVSQHGKNNIYIKQSFFEIFNNSVHFKHTKLSLEKCTDQDSFSFAEECFTYRQSTAGFVPGPLLAVTFIIFPLPVISIPYQKFLYSITALLVKLSTQTELSTIEI